MDVGLARHRGHLDRQQIAADFGPRQTGDLPDLVFLLGYAEHVAPHTEELVQVARRHLHALVLLLQQQLLDDFTADLADLALE